jgi:sulfatase maturation enzyme AslB (radical SAM superfamily)
MPKEIGWSAVDYILSNPDFGEDSVILDFIGGEPLIEIKRIEEICGYFVKRAAERDHRWSTNYTIRITTNGLLYDKDEVQAFLTKYNEHISISISLDGTKRKNDTNRVFVTGKGTYDSILALMHFILYADGKHDLIDISNRINVPVDLLLPIIDKLFDNNLIEVLDYYEK